MSITYNIFYIVCLSLTVSAFFSFIVSKYGYKILLIDTPNERSSHSKPIPRGGGIGILIAYIGIGLYVVKNYSFILISSSIGLLGFIDDYFKLSSKIRLIIQVILAIFAVYQYYKIIFLPADILFFSFHVLFIVGTANFYNFMDGINGMSGLTGFVTFGLTTCFSYYIAHNIEITLMCISLASACIGFLPFNVPNARVFMGDVGSIFLGFVFALFVLKLSLNINTFICITMFFCVFYADALVTIFYRWQRGENLTQAHRKHLYQYLSNEFAFDHWKVSLIYACVQLFFGSLALFAYTKGFVWQIVILVVFIFIFLTFYSHLTLTLTKINFKRHGKLIF
ncbi:MAG: glycosyltransferase family 4 protein [Nitrospirae bacterium]|nr:glycosyltransferase family 4 protein [Nitrospirota bacterium]